MTVTFKKKGGSSPRRQTRRIPNPYRKAAKDYVAEIKKLRVELKGIQKMYRDADSILNNQSNEKDTLIKAMDNKGQAEKNMLEKYKKGFPLPKKDGVVIRPNNPDIFRIIKKITIKERWNIIATGYLMIRPLEERRRRMEALYKFEGAMEPIEFRNKLKFFERIISELNPDNRIVDGSDLSGPYGHAPPPAYENPGPLPSYKSKESSIFGFPITTPPPQYPPPNYDVGGSDSLDKPKVYKRQTKKRNHKYK